MPAKASRSCVHRRGDGLTESWTYNGRMQAASISVETLSHPTGVLGLNLCDCPDIACPAGTVTCMSSVAGAAVTNYVYDAFGKLAAEYVLSGTKPAAPCTTCYLSVDHLGSTRALTDGATGNVVERHDFLPFGEELSAGVGGRTAGLKYLTSPDLLDIRQRFTGKERDAETGLDWFETRYLSSAQGRFTSPDPLFIRYSRLADPQSLNLYAYAHNNPLKFVDPLGMEVFVTGEYTDEYLKQLNSRDKAAFQVTRNAKTGQLVAGKVTGKLTDSEKALLNAINSKDATATINTVRNDPTVGFGQSDGPGKATVDVGDVAKFGSASNQGGITPGGSTAHETVEALMTAQGMSVRDAHMAVGQLFPGMMITGQSMIPGPTGTVAGLSFRGTIQSTEQQMVFTIKFDSPIPAKSFSRFSTAEEREQVRDNLGRVDTVTCCGNKP
jgi:RHS repeat-associated protein